MEEVLKQRLGDHWSRMDASQGNQARIRWWQHPRILRHINRLVCGEPFDGASQGLTWRACKIVEKKLPLKRGISVGCGNGSKELALIRQGLVQSFDLFELAETRITEGRSLALKLGLGDAVRFIHGDAFELVGESPVYDLVHWNNALHHMMDVENAVRWSYSILQSGGLFYMDDFVGPDRFQWTPEMLEIASSVRKILPDFLLKNPRHPHLKLATTLTPPDPGKLCESDPSEAADSSRILDQVRQWFPQAEIVITGGVIYHLALSDVLGNIEAERDQVILDLLLLLDQECARNGLTHYATALAVKD